MITAPIRRLAVALGVLALLVTAAMSLACETATKPASGDLSTDQTLRIAISGEPESLDPAVVSFGAAAGIERSLFATLLRFDPVTGQVVAYAAEQVPTVENQGVSSDGLNYTFKIKKDAKWEDGTPLTASDFEYAIKRILDPRVASYYGQTYYAGLIAGSDALAEAAKADPAVIEQLKQAVEVNAIDAHTLQIRLARPSATFNMLMSLWPSAAVRQDVVGADVTSSAWAEPGKLVASGSFRLVSWEHGSRVVLERNPQAWDKATKPTLQRIDLVIIDSAATAIAAYQTGQVDVAAVPASSLAAFSGSDELHRVPVSATLAVVFNNSVPQFDSVAERKAFCQAIDRDTLVKQIGRGLGQPSTSWLPAGLDPWFDSQRGASLRLNDAARTLLGSDNYGAAKLIFANIDPESVRAQFLQGQWSQDLGVSIELSPLDPRAFGRAFGTGQYDMALVGFSEDYHHPENWLLQWMSDNPMNVASYNDPAFDSAIKAALRETNATKAVQLWQQADATLIDKDVAICPLMTQESAWVVKPYVDSLVLSGADGLAGDSFWWKTGILKH
ncbi:MAG TPA: peptide ABC transporter substrate-binding protein [Dehalococcoidia bacterium]|nr:peptide ABC transporter substrate-binding protein [Dehalococcoidia bacterium]